MQDARTTTPVKLRNLVIPLLAVALVVCVAVFIRVLFAQMDASIQQNGETSMQAVVEQVEQTYELQIENYYSRLRTIEKYTAQGTANGATDLLDDEGLARLVNTLEEGASWKVFFIKDNGSAMTIDGQTSEGKFLIAIPCNAYELGGQTFTAIGALVDRSTMDAALKLYAYNGDAHLFMLNADGEVIYTNQSDEKLFQNYSLLKHLVKDGALLQEESESLQASFDGRVSDSSLYAGDENRVREYGSRIQVSSQALLGILNEVLDMNKIESGKTTLNVADFSVLDLARDVEAMFRPQTDAKGQTFEVVTNGIDHAWLRGDSVRLMQIVTNLLSNAVKYTQPGGTILFIMEERPASSAAYAKLSLVVEDNGVGMDADFQDKIFDAFTREESTLTNKVQGTGLGMAITKSLVELMGGAINVTSEKGRGSRFEVLLDMKIAEVKGEVQPQRKDAGAVAAKMSLEGIKFLCAEDNALNAEILAEILALEGARCTICENGKVLLDTFEKSKPGDFDMILMDIQMPVMNGYEAARAVCASSHECAASVPIIAMTANAFSEDIQASLAAGMNVHVSKPIDMGLLKKAVAGLK